MAWQPDDLELTNASDPHLRFTSFNHTVTINKSLEITNELIKRTLNNMSLSYYQEDDKYKITKLDINRATLSCSVFKLEEKKTLIGFNIVLSYAKTASYRLMYSILERIMPDISIPPILRERKLECCHDKPKPVCGVYIDMLKSPFIDQIDTALKGIAHSGCEKKDCCHYLPYLPYIGDIMNISKTYANPRSEYEGDIFALSVHVVTRILTSQKAKYLPIIKEIGVLSNNFCKGSIDDECKYSCMRSINSLSEVTVK
jgi:hypothetical protein